MGWTRTYLPYLTIEKVFSQIDAVIMTNYNTTVNTWLPRISSTQWLFLNSLVVPPDEDVFKLNKDA